MDDKNYYISIANNIKSAFNKRFFDKKLGYYREENQGFHLNAQILPLAFGLTPKRYIKQIWQIIEEKIPSLTRLDCGILSLKYLFTMLTERGLGDLAYDMITDKKYLSYGNPNHLPYASGIGGRQRFQYFKVPNF